MERSKTTVNWFCRRAETMDLRSPETGDERAAALTLKVRGRSAGAGPDPDLGRGGAYCSSDSSRPTHRAVRRATISVTLRRWSRKSGTASPYVALPGRLWAKTCRSPAMMTSAESQRPNMASNVARGGKQRAGVLVASVPQEIGPSEIYRALP
jgi:hypothetical protein